ncbi:hypothetical protein OB2597_04163 [Pseudooceanicola batsensis HTCC2597]|uniref:Probable membrane transporter protein n=1 Tax=Pseudooceanicola batsensis (strain ATCC BAA-863 / DSM 15984 / KCTC 12145 / HTCC2597) TaxID=252305 RepID=A3U2M9_PSEBH|nr:sulfite exporter TauE/SafE family protein [Pseudooceanicola batsensis]EAQ01603.1 hypothetical protein OB2597_04163 [Pseudooceanicola batsensis HTCC2597]
MPDWLPEGVSAFGLVVLLATVTVSGVVYGFAGFGAALIFVPVAARVVPLEVAIAAFNISAVSSLVTVVPRAWREVDRPATVLQIALAGLTASLGIWVLRVMDVTVLRWAVTGVVALTLLALVSGWRYRAVPTLGTRGLVGLGSGFVGGATGLLGPVVVVFQLAGRESAARSRATTLVFLTVTSVLLLPLMAAQGLVTWAVIPLGLIMLVPYGLGTWLGHLLFRPDSERLYRGTAYLLIAAAVIMGLPLFD